jgi:ribonucleotide reductase beta subunit family protein with ferritin-like domain
MKETGNISIHTENIFPIIKKFLYSDHEIFLRELVSNAVDATQKIKRLSSIGEFNGELGDLKVQVSFDKDKKTITISDNGIGMTAEEIKKYINQIAFSGAEEFVQQYKGNEGAEQIIGHFGLGFYSGFMVALSFRQRNQLRNFGSMISWVLRDESLHLKFGINLVHTVLEENKELLTEEFAEEIRSIVIEGVDREVAYNKDLFPKGILGLNADYVNQYVQYVADRRLEELGLEKHYNVTNPAKWMSTATDVLELVNFFESQNTSYEVDSSASGHKKA